MSAAPEARRLLVRGLVQSVGFRPFVYRLARRLGVTGSVRNVAGVVEIHAEGPPEVLDAFAEAVTSQAPPLARVESVVEEAAALTGALGFSVAPSADAPSGAPLVSPDVATCAACLRELLDPADRRYRYPFINCTDCGPRFTIIEALPYDRERTSMRVFPMCDECRAEYQDPGDRRFHAEPVACPACGPRLRILDASWAALAGDPVERAADLLREGAIVAIKGLGGFHLACDATDETAVGRLRDRKDRPSKPFAVMVDSLETARGWFALAPAEEALLDSWQAPVVLVRDRGLLAPCIAPGHRRQGAMLPSTPLHHLLTRAVARPLVMTSGNRSEEPIAIEDEDARDRLAGIADAFLVHDRRIVARYDDSVTRVWRDGPAVLRRARSLAPAPIELAFEVRPTLGVGAELHATFCLAAGRRAYVSQHAGDLDTGETIAAYEQALERYRLLFRVEPEVVAHDLHPDFASTRLAESTGLPRVAVQHHHAHVAAVLAECGVTGPALGVAFDGFGLGVDGTGWGGELLLVDGGRAERVGHLRAVRQPGGDAAVRRPVRMAIAHAADAGVLDEAVAMLGDDAMGDGELAVVLRQIETGLGSPWTTSAGRLFDAISALAGVCRRSTYEGEPAILLEQAADPAAGTPGYPMDLADEDGALLLDPRPLVAAAVRDLRRGASAALVSARFHMGLADAVAAALVRLRDETGVGTVALAGGVFANDLLLTGIYERLERDRFVVHVPRGLPPGDGGVSLGQVLVASARG